MVRGLGDRMESDFERELSSLLNRHSKENDSNTPDYQLAVFIIECLQVFTNAVTARDAWYGMNPEPGTDWASRVPELPEKRPTKRLGG